MKLSLLLCISMLGIGCCSPRGGPLKPPPVIPAPELRTAKLVGQNATSIEWLRAYELDLADQVGHNRALRAIIWPDEGAPKKK